MKVRFTWDACSLYTESVHLAQSRFYDDGAAGDDEDDGVDEIDDGDGGDAGQLSIWRLLPRKTLTLTSQSWLHLRDDDDGDGDGDGDDEDVGGDDENGDNANAKHWLLIPSIPALLQINIGINMLPNELPEYKVNINNTCL